MKNILKYFIVLLAAFTIASCEDFLQPRDNNPITDEMLNNDPVFMEGLLLHAYKSLPSKYDYNSDAATDNAVSNVKTLNYLLIANGAWTSEFTPYNNYGKHFTEIYYINKFLSLYENVNWSADKKLSAADNTAIAAGHLKRLKGEAHGLRAYYQYQLLQTSAGVGSNNELLGFPIVTDVITADENYKLPRNTFADCVKQILSDCNVAIQNLPARYEDIKDNNNHNKTFGVRFLDRIDARGAMAIKAQVLLLAASPAFNPSNEVAKWEAAAEAAASLINDAGKTLPANGLKYYNLATATTYNTDVIWANSKTNRNDFEQENYPPSLYGKGGLNPSQNLVDAFPMANGFPINETAAAYDPSKPYNGRDLRFAEYIIADGQTYISPINTYVGADKDGLNNLVTSTRTGYYLKKFMDPLAKYNPATNTWSNSARSFVHFRYTQMFLNFAEAANEAWGPTGDPKSLGFSAQSVLQQIRKRAGIAAADPYLLINTGTDKEKFRALVRNERRVELCFEGSRFWDIRRWNENTTMKQGAKGISITNNQGLKTYQVIDVEPRRYADFMIYPPVPYAEVVKTGLVQNKGWN
jgi:hypothetical protein